MVNSREDGLRANRKVADYKQAARSGIGLVTRPRFAETAVRVAASLGAHCAITVTALVMLGSQSSDNGPVLWHCGMMTGVALFGLVAVFVDRDKTPAKIKRRLQTGTARAGPRG